MKNFLMSITMVIALSAAFLSCREKKAPPTPSDLDKPMDNYMSISRTVLDFDSQWSSLDNSGYPDGFTPSKGKITHWGKATIFPTKNGDIFSFDFSVPDSNCELEFSYGIDPGEKTVETGSAVFSIMVDSTRMFVKDISLTKKKRLYSDLWFTSSIELEQFRNKKIKLSFKTTCPPEWTEVRPGWCNISIKERKTVKRTKMSEKTPNVLVILVDTLRWDRMGFNNHNYKRKLTPFLDSLAKSSVVFEKNFSPSTWTWPSVSSLFTGQNPVKHGVGTKEDSKTKLGYKSLTIAEYFQEKGFTTVGISANPLISAKYGFNQGFESYVTFEEFWETKYVPMPASGINREFSKWLENNGDNRFFAYLHYMDPHSPYCPPAPFFDKFVSQKDGKEAMQIFQRTIKEIRFGDKDYLITDEVLKTLKGLYDAEVLYLDAMLSELFNYLQQKGYLNNTIVLFTADHGDEFFEHGQFGHGFNLYNETLKTPALIFYPATLSPARIKENVSIMDFFPTLCDLAGIEPPSVDFDGVSLVKESFHSAPVLLSTYHAVFPGKGRFRMLGLLDDNFKLIDNNKYGEYQLYNLKEDQGETKNVYSDYPEKAEKMKTLLNEMFRNYSADSVGMENPLPDSETIDMLKTLGYVN